MGKEKKKEVETLDIYVGVKTVKKIVETSIKLKIPIITFMYFPQKIGKDQKLK